MLQNHRVVRFSAQPFNPPTRTIAPSLSPFQLIPNSPSFPILKQQCRLSRRELTIFSNSCLLLLLDGSRARAEDDVANTKENLTFAEDVANESNSDKPEENLTTTPSCTERKPTKQVFLDISIDGEPVGRITIGLYGNEVPAGVDRFSKIVSGAAGISYRRKEFVKIMPNYVQHGGLRSYGVDVELATRTGSNLAADTLVQEWEREYERCPGTKNLAGSIGIIVRNPSKPPPKLKLVAKQGKLEIDQEEVGTDPNGTEFVIATKDAPELDASTLVIGRVTRGMEVVQRIGQVKTVQENTGSPYFRRVAKLIGDKRAVVAERGFNRPYSKVIVTNCGLM
uniref:Peptidyl-prolyl cis-trans isomerase B n=1 Tax=Cajanus cajan TaxID=3821 RepID=A0A151SLL2_CAJCA|nr:Peptidyl-prolyl cis-trans isomerase B [Cajanus cajan]